MNDSIYLANKLRELFLMGKWIANTNYKHCLESITWQQAIIKHPNNSIAELVQHVHYYLVGVMDVLQGKPLTIKDKYSFDFEEIKSKKEWDNFLSLLWNDVEKFAFLVEKMTDEKLKITFEKDEYGSNHRNIYAIVEHSYYHLGQIVLIKKQLG